MLRWNEIEKSFIIVSRTFEEYYSASSGEW